MRRSRSSSLLLLPSLGALFALTAAGPALAVPPPGLAAATHATKARWVQHRVISGERIKEIAERYAVDVGNLLKWNKLDQERPLIRAGQQLRVLTRIDAPVRERITYRVRRGDSWNKIARRHNVDQRRLRKHWNRKQKEQLRAGDKLTVWVERQPEPESELDATHVSTHLSAESSGPDVPTVAVPMTGQSVGSPGRGRLLGGVQLPPNEALYTVRRPEQSFGSSHTIENLQSAIARFRKQTGFPGEIVIGDISRRRGGRFRPHRSHRSGRDADIRLPLAPGVPKGTVPLKDSQVDWDAAWKLIDSMIDTGQVEYVFLSRSRQRSLEAAARRAGVSPEERERLIQFPHRNRTAVIRHSRGHVKHFHVRFKCGPNEPRCRER